MQDRNHTKAIQADKCMTSQSTFTHRSIGCKLLVQSQTWDCVNSSKSHIYHMQPRICQISIVGPIPRGMRRGILQASCRSVRFFTLTGGLQFYALLPHIAFLSYAPCIVQTRHLGICSLEISNVDPIHGAVCDGVLCRPVQDCTPFAPTNGLHFKVLISHSFLFMCTFHGWKHGTWGYVTTNLPKFPMQALQYQVTIQNWFCQLVSME